jgi:hypothetical protein
MINGVRVGASEIMVILAILIIIILLVRNYFIRPRD